MKRKARYKRKCEDNKTERGGRNKEDCDNGNTE